MAAENSWETRFKVVAAGAEDDDDDDEDFALAEAGRGQNQDGELRLEDDDDGNDEEAILHGRSRRRRCVRGSITDAQHGWALGAGESEDEDDHPTVEWNPKNRPSRFTKLNQNDCPLEPDVRTDRDLVDFLTAFDCEAVYEVLYSSGMTVFALLESTEQDMEKILPGKENLVAHRKLCYGIDKMRKHEWISNEAVNVLVNLLDASRLPPPRDDGTPHHNFEQAMEERQRAIRKAQRDLGSVTQQVENTFAELNFLCVHCQRFAVFCTALVVFASQVNAGSRLLGFLSSGTSYLKKIFSRDTETHEAVGYDEDLEEIRINATNIVVAADKLKQSLTALRAVLLQKASCETEKPNSQEPQISASAD